MRPFIRVGQVVVAAFFASVIVTFWVMMAMAGRGDWLSLDRAFSESGMYVDMHSLIQLNIIGIPITIIAALRALQMFGKFPEHAGIRFANRLFLCMGLASVVAAAWYFRLWDDLLPAKSTDSAAMPTPPSDADLPFPELPLTMAMTLHDLEGNTVELANLEGKVVFLNIWATWCGFCKYEFPNIQRLYDAFREDPNVVFLLVSDEEPEVVKAWSESEEGRAYKLPFYTTQDFGRYEPDGYPTTHIIGRDGQTVFSHSGFVAWDGEKTKQFLRDLAVQAPIAE